MRDEIHTEPPTHAGVKRFGVFQLDLDARELHRSGVRVSLVAELVRRREITALAARDHPHRHVLTRALGVRRTVEPDLAELTPNTEDTFVLCSDGLTGHVS